MKRLIFVLLSLNALCAMAQFKPNTKWPYLYEEFSAGKVYCGNKVNSDLNLNIHLWGNALHYISPDGKILESTYRDISRVEILGDVYLMADDKLMKLVASKNNNVLLLYTKGDFASLNNGGGAYGASLNSSATMELTSLDLGGMDKPALAKLQQEKNDGRVIPLTKEYYFIIGDELIEATKKEMNDNFSSIDGWKQFLSDNKIKWKREESLIKILDFFADK